MDPIAIPILALLLGGLGMVLSHFRSMAKLRGGSLDEETQRTLMLLTETLERQNARIYTLQERVDEIEAAQKMLPPARETA